jgi:branched-chain amino acid transport system substrate-binding protein
LGADAAWAQAAPIRIGVDAEFGVLGSTSAQSIALGASIAADEINAHGGLLGGRMIEIVEKDDRSVPARANQNLRDLAADANVVAVLCGRYSPVAVELVPTANALGIPLLDPWAAADSITQHGSTPDYIFRLSMRDSWAMQAMIGRAVAKGQRRIGLLLPATEWGRSSERAVRRLEGQGGTIKVVAAEWYNWGDPSLREPYMALRKAGAQAVIFVGNEREGAILARELAALPAASRLPVMSHWGITGGLFQQSAGDALRGLDFTVVQTYSFVDAEGPVAKRVLAALRARGLADARRIPSPVGLAHAYDLVHILARAITKAGSADRAKVRDALETVSGYDGLVRNYARPFEPGRHDALTEAQVFMAGFAEDGAIVRAPAKSP